MKTHKADPLVTIATASWSNRTYYLDVMPSGKFRISLDEVKKYEHHSYTNALCRFKQIAFDNHSEIEYM